MHPSPSANSACRPSLVIATLLLVACRVFADDSVPNIDLKSASLAELGECLDSAPFESKAAGGVSPYEAILVELVRRGGPDAERLLSARIAAQDATIRTARLNAATAKPDTPESWKLEHVIADLERNLELVTALRRVTRQHDPLAVLVSAPAPLKALTRELPVLDVSLKNADVGRLDIGLKHGGDYRSGRHARWRIHVRDAEGKLLAQRPSPSFIGGGIFQDGPLLFGESWETQLPLDRYVRIEKPGKYQVEVLYHNSATIADLDDPAKLEELIVFRSEPLELIVESGPKIPIRLMPGSTAKAKSLIEKLEEKEALRVVMGKYDQDSYEFISPKSPQGELLAMKWQAVPALVEALENERLSFRKRAWLITLLYSITLEEELNPVPSNLFMDNDLLPAYETRGSAVKSLEWKGGASYQWSGSMTSSGGTEDVTAQRAFARRWLQFRDQYFEIEIEK